MAIDAITAQDCLAVPPWIGKWGSNGQSAANTDTENRLQQVEALRAELKGGPIPLDELVAATERDSH